MVLVSWHITWSENFTNKCKLQLWHAGWQGLLLGNISIQSDWWLYNAYKTGPIEIELLWETSWLYVFVNSNSSTYIYLGYVYIYTHTHKMNTLMLMQSMYMRK